MVLDLGQMMNPSCSSQWDIAQGLQEWGCQIRIRRPKPGMTSCQHEKAWLFDEALYVAGSANSTYNSIVKCEENVLATRASHIIAQAGVHFERVWEQAQEFDVKKLQAQKKEKGAVAAKSSPELRQ